MTLVDRLEELCSDAKPGETLRFSVCDAGYRWQSVKTNSFRRVRFLLECWNNRAEIIGALRKE